MVNKSLLPVRFRLPVLGEYVFYTRGLKYNFELIFFWGPGVWKLGVFGENVGVFLFFFNPIIFLCVKVNNHSIFSLFLRCSVGSLFENEWSLKPEYKRGGNRLELADRLASRILWIGIANLLLCPVILVWQILYAFFSYTEVCDSDTLKLFIIKFFHVVLIGLYLFFGVFFWMSRWSNGSLVLLERDAGLFMADVTCVTLMSWTMSSCHALAKATRSAYKLLTHIQSQ